MAWRRRIATGAALASALWLCAGCTLILVPTNEVPLSALAASPAAQLRLADAVEQDSRQTPARTGYLWMPASPANLERWYGTNASAQEVDDLYERELPRNGWEHDTGSFGLTVSRSTGTQPTPVHTGKSLWCNPTLRAKLFVLTTEQAPTEDQALRTQVWVWLSGLPQGWNCS